MLVRPISSPQITKMFGLSCAFASFACGRGTADSRRAELDSWTGNWKMIGSDGEKLGSHSLTRRDDGCLIVGRFAREGGAEAMSWTYFDAAADEWKQNWVTATGDVVRV